MSADQQDIGTLELKKAQLVGQVRDLQQSLKKVQEENRHLQEHTQAQHHAFTQKLEGSLQRLDANTTELARKLKDESSQTFQALMSEKYECEEREWLDVLDYADALIW
jgi:uncharacterized protein (DUF3084 family)